MSEHGGGGMRRKTGLGSAVLVVWALLGGGLAWIEAAVAGEAAVVAATLTRESAGTWRVSATVAHADEGWDHYADRWEVLAPDGTILATRELLHPHVEEQPFTRSLSGVVIPEGVEAVTIRAHDNVHGYGGAAVTVAVPGGSESQ